MRALWRLLAREAGAGERAVSGTRAELVGVVWAARTRLRQRPLPAEGVDPRTGRPGA
jgi:hypothetical protein